MRYLLTFKPLKNFFFGNSQTFSQDYVAKSEYFPQNTQLLGAIRLFIAEQHSLIKVHKNGKYSDYPEELKKLIGSASSENFMTNDDLGKIQNLSQMFIVNRSKDEAYFPTPFDIEVKDKNIKRYTLTNLDDDYFLKDYDVKNSSSQKLAGKDFWDKYIQNKPLDNVLLKDFDEIFIEHTQVGIELENKQTIDEKFYKKIDYKLDEKFLFGAIIELQEPLISNGIIQIGAETSLFELNIIPLQDTKLKNYTIISKLFTTPKKGKKFISLSETMCLKTTDFTTIFKITPFYKNFAMIKSKEKNYTKFNGKTKQKRLIPSGSVFYYNTPTNIKNSAQGAYKKMGYNQFININY